MSSETRQRYLKIFLIVGRIALAGVFLVAAYAKLKPQVAMPWSVASMRISLSMFAMQVDSYQLLPPGAVSLAAHWLPFFEFGLGVWLLSGLSLRFSSTATSLLLGGFFALVVRTYAMGIEINCGCFGPGERLGPGTLIRDGSLLALSLAVTICAFLIQRARYQDVDSVAVARATPQRAD